ncbi:MAG: hypothetical protein AB7K41_10455 [Bdellovibrionales bacterium]
MIKKVAPLLALIVPLILAVAVGYKQKLLPWSSANQDFVQRQLWLAKKWKSGELPLWNEQTLLGVPQLSDPNTTPFAPISLPWFVQLSPEQALPFLLLFCLGLAAMGTYRLAFHFSHHVALSLLAAFSYVAGGLYWRAFEAIAILIGLSLLPWSLWFMFKASAHRRPVDFAWLALSMVLMIYQGQVVLVFALTFVLTLFALFHLSPQARNLGFLVGTTGALVTTYLLSALYWLPAKMEAMNSTLNSWASMQLPATPSPAWNGLYPMAMMCLPALGALFFKLKKMRHQFLIVGLAALLFATSSFSRLNIEQIWQKTYGLVNAQDAWGLYGLLFLFAMLLSLLSLRRLLAWMRGNQGLCAVAGLAAFAHLLLSLLSWYAGKKQFTWLQGLSANEFTARSAIHMWIAFGFGTVAVLLLAAPERRLFRQGAWALLLTLTLSEGMALKPKVWALTLDQVMAPSPIAELPDPGRVLYLGFDEKHPLPSEFSAATLHNLGWSTFNSPTPFENVRIAALSTQEIFNNLAAWATTAQIKYILTPTRLHIPTIEDLMLQGRIEKQNLPENLGAELYRLDISSKSYGSARMIVTPATEAEAMILVAQRGENMTSAVVERKEAFFNHRPIPPSFPFWGDWLPRFTSQSSLAAQTPLTILNETRALNSRKIELIAVSPAVMVWREGFHPGWRLYMDGKETPTFRADFLNRGHFIKAGKQLIEFRFESEAFSAAIWRIGFGALLLMAFIILEVRKPRQDFWNPERY